MLVRDLGALEVGRCVGVDWEEKDIPVLEFNSGQNKETVAFHSKQEKSKSTFDCAMIPPKSKEKSRLCYCHGIYRSIDSFLSIN